MKKTNLAATFLALVLSSCTVYMPLTVDHPTLTVFPNSLKSHTYIGVSPDSLKTRDDVMNTFVNYESVSFKTLNDGDTWVFEWEYDKYNIRRGVAPVPKTLSFQFEGDRVVAWESQGLKLNPLTRMEKILIGGIVGLSIDVLFVVAVLQNISLY